MMVVYLALMTVVWLVVMMAEHLALMKVEWLVKMMVEKKVD